MSIVAASDVVIVGAGIIGASIAWRLAQAGARVTLIDAGRVGAQASTAGAGMLAPGGELDAPSWTAEMLLASHRLYPDFVHELAAESGVAIDYRRCGALELAATEAERDLLFARARRQSQLGIPYQQTDRGVFYPEDALVDPGHVMTALDRSCRRRGVHILEGSAATTIEPGEREVSIRGSGWQISGRAAVLAAGAWSSRIAVAGHEIRRSFPVKGHLLGYDLPPGSVPAIIRHGHTYILQRSSGLTVAGSTSEDAGFDQSVDASVAAELRGRAEALLPELLRDREPSRVWTGLRPAAESFLPVMERLPGTTVWLAYGHFRNGILAAPEVARLLAAEIAGAF